MKYRITGRSLQDHDTKLFLQSLIPHLRGYGHKLVDTGEDVVLSFGHSKDNGTTTALRWDSTCDINSLNSNVNAVIFSSTFEKDLFTLSHNNCHIINNGIDLEIKKYELPTGLQSIKQDYELIITLPIVSKFLDIKLIKQTYENIKLFSSKKCCLIVMSDEKYSINGNDIFFVPWLDDKERICLFSMSNFVLYVDNNRSNPHELLETLSQGTRIINVGQREIADMIKSYGIAPLQVTKPQPEYPWDLQHIDIQHVTKKYSDLMISLR